MAPDIGARRAVETLIEVGIQTALRASGPIFMTEFN
jgi:hypothetical protein